MPSSQLWVLLSLLPLGCIVHSLDEVLAPLSLTAALLLTSGGGEFSAGRLQSPHPAGIMHHLLRAHTGAHLIISSKCFCLLTGGVSQGVNSQPLAQPSH